MAERVLQTFDETPMAYRPDALEVEAPSEPSEPGRDPGVTDDLATIASRRDEQAEEAVEIDMTIGVGEDPGWHRALSRRRWRDTAERTALREA